MDEATAWQRQAQADFEAGAHWVQHQSGATRCQAMAKFQQAVEKAVKGLVIRLRTNGIMAPNIVMRHDVERYVSALVRRPRDERHGSVSGWLSKLFDPQTRSDIRFVDELAPSAAHRRNTEYPYIHHEESWTFPADEGTFTADEVVRVRQVAYRLTDGLSKLQSSLRRLA